MFKLDPKAASLHFDLAMRIAQVHDEYVRTDTSPSFVHRNDGANPYFGQTDSGLYLSCYYGSPRFLWTPWGEWHFTTTMITGEMDQQSFMARFQMGDGIQMISPDDGQTPFYIYPLYALDGETLPTPVLTPRGQYLPYQEACDSWKLLATVHPTP